MSEVAEMSNMTIDESRAEAKRLAKRCETCAATDVELFGYHTGGLWRWFCAAHRLAVFWADARRSP
jgi:hypothetical protein